MWLDDTVNWNRAVKRLVWGKMVNLGQVKKLKKNQNLNILFSQMCSLFPQTCVAPDYVLCTK